MFHGAQLHSKDRVGADGRRGREMSGGDDEIHPSQPQALRRPGKGPVPGITCQLSQQVGSGLILLPPF